jgi:Protein of unknown function (DUF1583)
MGLFCVLLLAATPSASPNLRQEFSQDFQKGEFELLFLGPNARDVVRMDKDGLHVVLPAGKEKQPAVGAAARLPVKGDFEITTTFEIVPGRPAKGEQPQPVQLNLYVTSDAPTQDAATLGRIVQPDKGVFLAHRAVTNPGNPRLHESETVPTSALSGKLRLTRVGPTLHYFAAEGDGDFTEIRQVNWGTNDLNLVRLAVEGGAPHDALHARFGQLTIKAEKLPTVAQPATWLGSGAFWWILGSALAVASAGGAWLWLRFFRKEPPAEGKGRLRPASGTAASA